jgi:hypothetical protein
MTRVTWSSVCFCFINYSEEYRFMCAPVPCVVLFLARQITTSTAVLLTRQVVPKTGLCLLSSNDLREFPLAAVSSPVLQPTRAPRLMMSFEGVDVGGRKGERQTDT